MPALHKALWSASFQPSWRTNRPHQGDFLDNLATFNSNEAMKTISLPGDKSISHRVAMLAAIAEGECTIENFNTGADCSSTLSCLKQLGVLIEGDLRISPNPLRSSEQPLDCGNSGSTIRMLTGLLAGQQVPATLTGDESLLRRPMGRLAEPLRQMGAMIELRSDNFAPITLREGVKHSIEYKMAVPSAQVKSAVLFAGLKYPGTRVIERVKSRDHTERLLDYLNTTSGNLVVPSFKYVVPGDPSSAAFLAVAAFFGRNSEITFTDLLVNPYRTAYFRKLQDAGAQVELTNLRVLQNEPVSDVTVLWGDSLRSIVITPEEVPSLIDEIPALAILGTSCGFEISGAGELRYKESDRIHAIVSNLKALGIDVEEKGDGFKIMSGKLQRGTAVTLGDHRIAMAFAAAGLEVDDKECVKISFPEFFGLLES
jgi:3-phosphoshikimate 1-carboxyvinyltransferase